MIQASPPPRNVIGRSPQVSPPGSPGRATVDVRQSSRPVSASCAVMKQPSSQNRRQPAIPDITFPRTMSEPPVKLYPLSASATSASQTTLPARASSATMFASAVLRMILSS